MDHHDGYTLTPTQQVFKELVATERVYVKDLASVMEVCNIICLHMYCKAWVPEHIDGCGSKHPTDYPHATMYYVLTPCEACGHAMHSYTQQYAIIYTIGAYNCLNMELHLQCCLLHFTGYTVHYFSVEPVGS